MAISRVLGAGGGSRTLTPPWGQLILSQPRIANFATPARRRIPLHVRPLGPRRQRVQREALRALAAERVAERREGLLVVRVADRDAALAGSAFGRRPRRQRDLLAERRVGRAEHPVGA